MSTRVRSFVAAAVTCTAVAVTSLTVMAHTAPASFYDIETKALDGKPGKSDWQRPDQHSRRIEHIVDADRDKRWRPPFDR